MRLMLVGRAFQIAIGRQLDADGHLSTAGIRADLLYWGCLCADCALQCVKISGSHLRSEGASRLCGIWHVVILVNRLASSSTLTLRYRQECLYVSFPSECRPTASSYKTCTFACCKQQQALSECVIDLCIFRQGAAGDRRHGAQRAGPRAGVLRQPGQARRPARQGHAARRRLTPSNGPFPSNPEQETYDE